MGKIQILVNDVKIPRLLWVLEISPIIKILSQRLAGNPMKWENSQLLVTLLTFADGGSWFSELMSERGLDESVIQFFLPFLFDAITYRAAKRVPKSF